jgi:hypothetical protein
MRGEAHWSGDPNEALVFLSPAEVRRMRSINQAIKSERRASDVYIRGTVW